VSVDVRVGLGVMDAERVAVGDIVDVRVNEGVEVHVGVLLLM
jgi:hypothetical protein